ncbi:MAG: hypothetical protein IIT60_07950 [Muribaculaceae bacterium]|nr:hypothetical protein [Muribaculaceae bacterium]
MEKKKITEQDDFSYYEEGLEKKSRIPQEPITEIETLKSEHFALGDRVYYIRPYRMCKVKCSTIKQFIWDRNLILPGYDIVLDNGDVVRDTELFHTLADARSKVIEELKFFIANDKKMVMGLQREIAIFERRLATLKSLDEKKRNQSNPPQ